MGLLKVSTLLLPVLFTLSCSSPDPAPPQKTVFDPLTQQVDRAKDVQNSADANAAATRKAVDAQERGDAPP
jgi:hypothetical protein